MAEKTKIFNALPLKYRPKFLIKIKEISYVWLYLQNNQFN